MSLEYVTGTEFILANDSIGIFVLNTGQLPGSTQILERFPISLTVSGVAQVGGALGR